MASLKDIREQHQPSYRSRRTGMGAISGRPLSAWSVKCSCGWEKKTNENKASVESDWKFHTREIWEQQRNPGSKTANPTTSPSIGDAGDQPSFAPQSSDTTATTLDPGMADFLAWQARQEQVAACPCCGGKAHWRVGNRRDEKKDQVECSACGLTMMGTFEPESALSKWNQRATSP